MTTTEFSNTFDVLYNNITSNEAPGLNEYEKSIFLTKAQEEIVKNYFNPKGNKYQEGFDDAAKRQADFSSLIKTATLSTASAEAFDRRSLLYRYPFDVFIVINEQLQDSLQPYTVVPLTYIEYNRLMQKPYKYPPKNQAWRLITSYKTTTTGPSTVTSYYNDKPLRTVSSYGKPVNLIVAIDTTSAAPVITEDSHLVTIITVMGQNLANSGLYFNQYIYNNADIIPYLGTFNDPSDPNDSTWPSFDQQEMAAITAGTVIYNITNPGGVSNESSVVEVIGRFADATPTYKMRYVKRPQPILLVNLSDIDNTLSINGVSTISECELPDHLHDEILQRAVELAKVAWTATGQENVQLTMTAGQRSE